jgi:two-component system chemotaxis sensor kinase CheA
VDLTKYRALFLEEATEHLGEMGSALLRLEKEPSDEDAIELIFRMAHSVKGMAASLDFGAITELAHRLEDRMTAIRDAGCIAGPDELTLLFRGLEGLESMIRTVRESDEPPAPDAGLAAALAAPARSGAAPAPKKKVLTR